MIVVTTPTGQIGRRVVQTLLAANENVRVIARDPDRLPPAVRERADVVQGEHIDPAVTLRAFEGAAAVFHVVPPETSAPDVRAHYRAFAEAAAPALTARGVGRVVAAAWLMTFRGGFMDALGIALDEQRDIAQAVETQLAPALRQSDGGWIADYVRLRFTMRKPG